MAKTRSRPTTPPAILAEPPETYVLEAQIGFLIRKAHQRATEIFNEVMGGFELTPTQFAALAKLDDVGPVSQNQLGRLIAMDPATIFGVAGRLIKRGLVRQDVDAGDQRLVLLSLTPEGKRLVTEMKAIGREVTRRTLAPLSPEEAALLTQLVERLG